MNVIVTGTKGGLVTYFQKYVKDNKRKWNFDFISLRNDDWKKLEFSSFDSIVHCVGITSVPSDNYEEFHKVNVEKTREVFAQAICQKASQFVYLSSMAVYDGVGWGFGKEGLITAETQPKQKTNYGKSKYEAEKVIQKMSVGWSTKVAIVRSPAIIGGGVESYFKRYIQFSKIPIVPIPQIHLEAKRSFVYIDTLIEFLCKMVEHRTEGVFFPQSLPSLSVSEMMLEVCKARGIYKRLWSNAEAYIPKAIQRRYFSQICYDESLSSFFNMSVGNITSREAIRRTI